MNNKRTLELSHDEIELIEIALSHVGKELDNIAVNDSDIVRKDIRDSILNRSTEYINLKLSIQNGEKDV